MAEKRDESIITGTRAISGSVATILRKRPIASGASKSGSSMQTSIIMAPPSICSLATVSAASNFSSRIRRANCRDPATFVRSPILIKLVSGRITSGSRPENAVMRTVCPTAASDFEGVPTGPPRRKSARMGLTAAASSAIALICCGVVPQHPPTRLTNSSSINSFIHPAISAADWL